MWDLLQSAGFLADAFHTSLDPMVQSLKVILPCRYCRDSFQTFYDQLGPPKVGSAAKWIFEVHNLVNNKLESQRIEAFLKDRNWPDTAKQDLRLNGRALCTRPTFEVVQKRFMVNRDEPFPRRGVSTVLLTLVMGLEASNDQSLYRRELLIFIQKLAEFIVLSKETVGPAMVLDLQKLLQAVRDKHDLRKTMERLKYSTVLDNQKAEQAASLIRAGACISGTCA